MTRQQPSPGLESGSIARIRRAPQSSSLPWTILFFLALTALVSRGLFEILVGKSAAYALQLGAVLIFSLALLLRGGPTLRRRRAWVAVAAWVFFVVALLSAFASLALQGIDYFGFFLAVTLFYASMLTLFTLIDFRKSREIAVGPVIAIVGIALVLVAFAQQFAGLTALPGGDFGTFGTYLRPASLTGSFLHYPIAASLMVFLLLGISAQQHKRRYLVIAAIVGMGVAASLSRSGIVILIVGVTVALIKTRALSKRLRIVGSLLLAALALTLTFPTGQFLERVTSIFAPDGPGNSNRIDIWTSILQLWSHSPLLIGSHAGEFTNVTANLAGVEGGVTESGLLQTLISWGALGLITFYSLLFGTASVLSRVPAWFFAGAIGGVVQSLVYQSIEVLPFMILFAWFPLIASAATRPIQPAVGRPTTSAEHPAPAVRVLHSSVNRNDPLTASAHAPGMGDAEG